MNLTGLELCEKCIERLKIKANQVKPDECLLCSGLLWKIDNICNKIAKELKNYEFDTFAVGTRLEGSIKHLEKLIFRNFDLDEKKSIKHHFNEKISKKLEKIMKKRIKHQNADITIIFNPEKNEYELSIKPIYIYGRYKKRIRNIPQTRWLCPKCNGKGCKLCNFTGKKYLTSVEELILLPLLKITQGEDGCLHGAGREDIDVRMLGNGRPFVIEVKKPRIRKINLKEAEKLINENAAGKVVVSHLKRVERDVVEYIKFQKFRKVYRAKVIFEKEISKEKLLKSLEKLKNTKILQRTPKRVEHRRADIIRERRTYDIRLILHKGKIAVIEIEADGGLYIKELINGDEGRTKPSLAEVLNTNVEVAKLDVIEVK